LRAGEAPQRGDADIGIAGIFGGAAIFLHGDVEVTVEEGLVAAADAGNGYGGFCGSGNGRGCRTGKACG
jgi:hypothetical protein